MKKIMLTVLLLTAALAVVGVGAALAQGSAPHFGGYGPMMGGGVLHDYMIAAFAEKTGLSVDAINARLASGERLYDIALSEGIAQEDLPALMSEIRASALDAAVKDGVITKEQADLMKTRGGTCDGTGSRNGMGPRGNRLANPQGGQ